MTASFRSIVREIVPPVLLRAIRRPRVTGNALSGNYSCWQDARADSAGYDVQSILERVDAATTRVVSGEAAFERDSVAFDRIEYSFPVLAGLLRAAIESGGELSVLDFGGSLGSSFRQCRAYLSVLRDLKWSIVEQEHFVRRGRERFETSQLRFHYSVQEAVTACSPAVVLVSSALQYLEHPHETLNELCRAGSRYLIVDRTPFADIPADRVVVQHVPESIYPASYPSWIFSRERFLADFGSAWEMVADFPSIGGTAEAGGTRLWFGGMIMRRRD